MINAFIMFMSFINHFQESILLVLQASDEQWHRAMDYVNAVSELNYMTQIVIMMYEDPTKVGQILK